MLFSGYTSIHQDAFSTIIIMLKMKDLSYQILDLIIQITQQTNQLNCIANNYSVHAMSQIISLLKQLCLGEFKMGRNCFQM